MFTDLQILNLASELNHILWTNDTPKVPEKAMEALAHAAMEVSTTERNMQCAAHMVVCGGLMNRLAEIIRREKDTPWGIEASNVLSGLQDKAQASSQPSQNK